MRKDASRNVSGNRYISRKQQGCVSRLVSPFSPSISARGKHLIDNVAQHAIGGSWPGQSPLMTLSPSETQSKNHVSLSKGVIRQAESPYMTKLSMHAQNYQTSHLSKMCGLRL